MTASAVSRVGDRFRRSSGLVVLLLGLGLMAGIYTAFAPQSQADDAETSIAVREGQKLYNEGCISCHGRNAQGVPDRGPSLIGVGAASVEFQVSTGRMPLARQEAQAQRKPPRYNTEQTAQLAAFIQSLGGGPQVPEGDLRDGDLAQGGDLFRVNCSSCHGFAGNGGALSSGKFAPALTEATDRQMYAAMVSGPQNMPVFGDNELTPDEKREIITYISVQLQQDKDPGGLFNLGRYGPTTEGLAIFVVGITILVFAALWIAGKS